MKARFVADSSANCYTNNVFASVPMKVQAGATEYVDDDNLNVPAMLDELDAYKGKSSSACPSSAQWLEAFGDAEEVYGVAITSGLSGCYNAARIAAEEYTAAHPERKVFILDSLSTGPEMELIVEKYQELVREGLSFEAVKAKIQAYLAHTHLMFSLESLANFAKNGRVNPAVAALAGLLGIRVVGKASDEGTLEPLHKCRGERKALLQLLASMKEIGYAGGKVRLAHSYNEKAALSFKEMILSHFPDADVSIRLNRGLCCYYAERGGLLVGFEG